MLLWRGLTRRCPWCGDRKAYFVGWFKRQDALPALRTSPTVAATSPSSSGAITANIILTFSAILIAILVTVVLTAARR